MLCSQRNAGCMQLFLFVYFIHLFTGASQMSVTKAGSNPFLLERSSPEKMLTLICLPKRKTTTCTKYSVCIAGCGTWLMIISTVNQPMKSVWPCYLLTFCLFCFFNLQFTMSSPSALMLTMNFGTTSCSLINSVAISEHFFSPNQCIWIFFIFTIFLFLFFCPCLQWGRVAFHSRWPWIPLWACRHLEHMVWRAGSGR